jgi:hypothetical protein
MDMSELIEQLQAERHRIDAAIKLLSGTGDTAPAKGKRRKLSPEGRARIAAAAKARWAKKRKKS